LPALQIIGKALAIGDSDGAWADKQLAKAGFVFTPSGPLSDLVKCPYCEYDVEEWDEDDDPMYVPFHGT